MQRDQCREQPVSAGDPGGGHKGVVAVVFALLHSFVGVLSQRESSGRTRGQLRRGGIRKGTRLEFVVEEGAMRGIWHRKALWRRKSKEWVMKVYLITVAVFGCLFCFFSILREERRGVEQASSVVLRKTLESSA